MIFLSMYPKKGRVFMLHSCLINFLLIYFKIFFIMFIHFIFYFIHLLIYPFILLLFIFLSFFLFHNQRKAKQTRA